MAGVPNLEAFTIHYNKLDGGIPTDLGGCGKLKELSLHHNKMSGPFPESLLDIVGMKRLFLSNNHFDPPSSGYVSELLSKGDYASDVRVGLSRTFVLEPQWKEGER